MRLVPHLLLLLTSCSSTSAMRDGGSETPGDWIAKGRSQLEQGDAAAAETSFQRAAELEPGSFHTRMWILRAWMEQGRSNDTLDALDELYRAGRKGPEMAYLYGMAFVRRAEGYLASGVTDSSITMNFQDAVSYLGEAVDGLPGEFPDAYRALATAAWHTQDLDLARESAQRAVAFYPKDGAAWLVLGRIAMSQFVIAQEGEAWGPAAEGNWFVAKNAFAEAVNAFGTPQEPGQRTQLSEAAQELGQAWIWKQDRAQAAQAFALAIGWAPERVDYSKIFGFLSGEGQEGALFRAALERGTAIFQGNAGGSDARAGNLLWWLGWARFQQRDFPLAEEAFLASLAKNPEFANAWYYAAMARFERQDWSGAAEALEQGWGVAPEAILSAMRADPETNAARVEYLIGQVFPAEIPASSPEEVPIPGASLLQVAHLAEICAETVPSEPRHWNNLGLFLRDEGDRLEQSAEPEPEPAVLADLYERAFAAYERALALAPEDPQILNDTAVMLHYYLDRDLERALEMYARAKALARARLEVPDLPPQERARFETALADSTDNRQALEELLADRARGGGR